MSSHLSVPGVVAVILSALVVLTSCATLNEDQCRTVQWFDLGQQDGAAGRGEGHIEEHRRSCAEHKLPVDEDQWRTGWEQGIRLYCTPENGLLKGRQGSYYANSCPAELRVGFETAYQVAKALHDARTARDGLQREMDSLLDQLRRAEKSEDRRRIEGEIDSKRFALRNAERRVWEAEGDYDSYAGGRGPMSRR